MKTVLMALMIWATATCALATPHYLAPEPTNPSLKVDQIVDHTGYSVGFSRKYMEPVWVSYQLTAEKANSKASKRHGNFKVDPDIQGGTATTADYTRSTYSRGHQAPAADMHWSEDAMKECFYYSNMCPQKQTFNAGVWEDLETQVRQFAVDLDVIYVVTGPVLRPGLKTIGPDKVAVPTKFYKVVLYVSDSDTMAIGFIVPTAATSRDLTRYAVPVDSVEAVTGLDFFNDLPDGTENRVESDVETDFWMR